MTWNYRIVRHRDGHLALHEVYYDERGKPVGFTVDPAGFVADSDETKDEIVAALELALSDARNRPVLDEIDVATDAKDS